MTPPSVGLVRKLVAVLEAVEKLVFHAHEPPGQVLNLQVIHRRLRFTLERAPSAAGLLDYSGHALRIEPLVSVEGLERFLNGVVSGCIGQYSVYTPPAVTTGVPAVVHTLVRLMVTPRQLGNVCVLLFRRWQSSGLTLSVATSTL